MTVHGEDRFATGDAVPGRLKKPPPVDLSAERAVLMSTVPLVERWRRLILSAAAAAASTTSAIAREESALAAIAIEDEAGVGSATPTAKAAIARIAGEK